MKKKLPQTLVIAKTVPLHDRASGDYRLFRILETLKSCTDIDYLSTWHTATVKHKEKMLKYIVRDSNFSKNNLEIIDHKYFDDLRSIGTHPLNQVDPIPFTLRPTGDYDIRPFLQKKKYDVIWIEFFYLADQYIQEIRRYQPWAHVIVDSVDLHFRRLARQCEFLENKVQYMINAKQERIPLDETHQQQIRDHRNYADHVKENELHSYERCDEVVIVSEDDQQELQKHLPNLPILFIPNIHRLPEISKNPPPWEKRKGVIFVGNFDHGPNSSSAIFLKHEVAPALAKMMSSVPFYIVGSNPSYLIRNMSKYGPHAKDFVVTGYVPNTLDYLNKAKVSVAPILFGAGMNGKIGEAIAAGVPVVTTNLGAMNMHLTHEENCLVAETPEEFAFQIKCLHEDKNLWEKISKNAFQFLQKSLSQEKLEKRIRKDFLQSINLSRIRSLQKTAKKNPFSTKKHITMPPAKFPRLKNSLKPNLTVIILTHNQWPYTELCLKSLSYAQKKNSHLKVEYLVVDNASTDETRQALKKIRGIKVIENPRNTGFAAGNNTGIRAASGKDIILLNNDTVVSPDWLARLSAHAQNIDRLGILGPSTNTETGQALFGAHYNSIEDFFNYNEEIYKNNWRAWEFTRKISGLCMYLPRHTIDTVGVLDEKYGIGYFEDDDYCLRTEDAGLRIVWAKDVYVHHFGSISFEHSGKNREKHLQEGMSQFIFKWGKRGLDHVAKAHKETLIRTRPTKSFIF